MVLSRCEKPLVVKVNGFSRVVPCGVCTACQSVKKYSWKKRLDNEFLFHRYGLAFTLTYSDQFLPFCHINARSGLYYFDRYDFPLESKPLTKDILNDLLTYYNVSSSGNFDVPVFNHYDLQQFIEKIKRYAKEIRYYIQTELGPTSLRPHAHGVLFFSKLEPDTVKDLIFSSWSFCDWSISKHRESIHLVDNASYCTSYVSSTVRLPKLFQFGKFRPFSKKSTSIPIGSQIFDKYLYQDYQCQEVESIAFLNSRSIEYEFLPFLRYHEDRYFPKLPFYNEYDPRTREFLYKSYSFFKSLFDPKIFCSKFTYDLYKKCFERLIYVSETFAEAVHNNLTSESSIYRIYLTSKKFYESWKELHPLLRDYAIERHFYNFEMKRLRLQYEYEEEFCNKRHYDPRYLIYKDPIFVKTNIDNYTFPHPTALAIVKSYGFASWDDFTSSANRFDLDHNPDVQNYLRKISEFSRLSHKSHAKNDYYENNQKQKPYYLKSGLNG